MHRDGFNVVECTVTGEGITCSDGVRVRVDDVVYFEVDRDMDIVFKQSVEEMIICSGLGFQVHVWGSDKYILWTLPRGLNKCYLIKGVFLDQCNEYLYVVSEKPVYCSRSILSECERELGYIAEKLQRPIFIFMDIDQAPKLPNIVKHSNIDECISTLSRLLHDARSW